MFSGVHNTYFVPVELSWKLGTSGFVVKTGLGIYAPTGTVQGVTGVALPNAGSSNNGFANFGNNYWTFQPELIVSYLADGWNLSAALYEEFNTANSQDNYTHRQHFPRGLHRHQDHREVDVRSCRLLRRAGYGRQMSGRRMYRPSPVRYRCRIPRGSRLFGRSADCWNTTSGRRACRCGRRRDRAKASGALFQPRPAVSDGSFSHHQEVRRSSRRSAIASGRLRSRPKAPMFHK